MTSIFFLLALIASADSLSVSGQRGSGRRWKDSPDSGNTVFFYNTGSLTQDSYKSTIRLDGRFSSVVCWGRIEMKRASTIFMRNFASLNINESPSSLLMSDGATIVMKDFYPSLSILNRISLEMEKYVFMSIGTLADVQFSKDTKFEERARLEVGRGGNVQIEAEWTVGANANIKIGDSGKLWWEGHGGTSCSNCIGQSVKIQVGRSASFYNFGGYELKTGSVLSLGQNGQLNISNAGSIVMDPSSSLIAGPFSVVTVNGSVQLEKNATVKLAERTSFAIEANSRLTLYGTVSLSKGSVIILKSGSSLTGLSATSQMKVGKMTRVTVEEGTSCIVHSVGVLEDFTDYEFSADSKLPKGFMCFAGVYEEVTTKKDTTAAPTKKDTKTTKKGKKGRN